MSSKVTKTSERLAIVFTMVILCVVSSGSITIIVKASIKFHDCPAEPFLPVWLIVTGWLLEYVAITKTLTLCCCSQIHDDTSMTPRKFLLVLLGPTLLFVWSVPGTIWVYRAYKPDFEESKIDGGMETTLDDNQNYCDAKVYSLSLGLVIISWILALLNMIHHGILSRNCYAKSANNPFATNLLNPT